MATDMATLIIDHRPPGSEALVLADILDIQQAGPLAAALIARRGGADLEIDASGVLRLGGLCLQVLLSAAKSWTADGATLAILNPSPAFIQGLELLGVTHAA